VYRSYANTTPLYIRDLSISSGLFGEWFLQSINLSKYRGTTVFLGKQGGIVQRLQNLEIQENALPLTKFMTLN
jgi:hypothetical protein